MSNVHLLRISILEETLWKGNQQIFLLWFCHARLTLLNEIATSTFECIILLKNSENCTWKFSNKLMGQNHTINGKLNGLPFSIL